MTSGCLSPDHRGIARVAIPCRSPDAAHIVACIILVRPRHGQAPGRFWMTVRGAMTGSSAVTIRRTVLLRVADGQSDRPGRSRDRGAIMPRRFAKGSAPARSRDGAGTVIGRQTRHTSAASSGRVTVRERSGTIITRCSSHRQRTVFARLAGGMWPHGRNTRRRKPDGPARYSMIRPLPPECDEPPDAADRHREIADRHRAGRSLSVAPR
jgi:hypothetical protein